MLIHADKRQEWIRGRRERRKLARAARVRRQILRYLLLCLLLASGAGALTLLPWRLADPDRDIEVRGNSVVAVEQIRGALASDVGKPLYKLDPQRLAGQVRSLEAVRYAFVRRYLLPRPHLVVEVLEEFPWATLATDPGRPPDLVISETGRLIPISQFPSLVKPQFKIYGTADLRLSRAQVAQWAAWVAYIEAQTGEKVTYLDMRQPQDVRVQDGDLYFKIGSADSTLTRRLARLASLMPALVPFRGRLEYVDLSLDNNVPLKVAKKLESAGNAKADSLRSPGSRPEDGGSLAVQAGAAGI
jgi:cell division septal protein FtsQ